MKIDTNVNLNINKFGNISIGIYFPYLEDDIITKNIQFYSEPLTTNFEIIELDNYYFMQKTN